MHQRALGAALALASSFSAIAVAETPAPADVAREADFLDVLPKFEVPEDVQPILGAVNEEFRNCEALWPAEYALSQSGKEARAFRDIYGYVKVRNVIATKDCTCAGKVAAWAEAELIASKLREESGKTQLGWQDTKAVFEASNELFPIAKTMCGGPF
jgi:hypothetical protein